MITGDTIAAFSSTVAPAARIIVRLSGPEAHPLAISMCESQLPAPASAAQAFLHFSNLRFPAWIYLFQNPRSYTGEDLIEFHLPGSPMLAQMLLDELIRRGARPAEPGEFTARAYLAGKMDLTEAEGVAATIAAGSDEQLQAGRRLLAGELARRLRPTMDQLAHTLALVEVGIDFSEEDVNFLPVDQIQRVVEQATEDLSRLLGETSRFERLAHLPRFVLVGRPNAGKSTLINALCRQSRAVVSHIAGTTRDVLTASVDLPHGRVELSDVAGLDDSPIEPQSAIERQMRRHALRAIESADHVMRIHDITDSHPPLVLSPEPDLTVFTKSDLQISWAADGLRVSAHTRQGLDQLLEAMDRLAFSREGAGVTLALNRRHVAAVEEARAALARVTDRVGDNAAELIALELRETLDALGRVLGSVTPDDVLGRIFSSFCIGK